MALKLTLVALATLLLNIPFGWYREAQPKFSFLWFVFIHAPIPAVVFMRLKSGIGFAWYTYPIMLGAYFAGQMLGSRLRRRRLQGGTDATVP